MEPITIASIAVVLGLGAFLHASLGFGAALFAMPLLALLIDLRTATPLVGLVMLTSILALLAKTWRHIHIGSTWRLVGGTALGVPVGLVLLKGAPADLVRACLGAVLVLYGGYSLLRPRLPAIRSTLWAYGLGFAAGVLGGAYNTNGPPVVLYGATQRWEPARFRGTLQGYFLPATVLICAGHGASGLWTSRVLELYVLTLPVVLIAIIAGVKAGGSLSGPRFAVALHLALVALGVLLIL